MGRLYMIGSYEVPEDRDGDFLSTWRELSARLSRVRGFVSARLHKSLHPREQFRFVAVTEWQEPFAPSPADLDGQLLGLLQRFNFRAQTAFYRVADEL